MARNKPLTIDAADYESSKLISPTVPILSNQKSTWDGMKVSYYQHSAAFETPEHHFAQHFISIHLNRNPILKQQVLNGRPKCDRFKNGDICLTPATAPVSVQLHDASELICLHLDPAFMRRITAEVTNVDSFELLPQFKLNDPLIYQIGIALKANLESQGVCDRLYTESMAMAISTHLLQFYSTRNSQLKSYSQGLSRAKLKKVTEYINENLTQNISLATMALMVQMSPFYFSRLFKKSTGLTPHQYLIKCRIEEAKKLLRISNLSMAAIAIEIGFADQSHFTRHFKRYVGITPSQFRAN